MNVAAYADLSRSLHQHYSGQRAPLEASIEVTLECLHCYDNLPMGDLPARNRELSKEEHFQLLDELADLGCLWLLYTGGEIFARKDFLEIYTYAKKKVFLVTLFSNGSLIRETTADYLRQWPPFAIEITLYGRTKETYEALTGIADSYERCLRGIELLRDRGLPVKLKTVPTTVNKHEVLARRQFAEEELHLEFKFDSLINPRIDCSQSPLAVWLAPEEVEALDLHSPKVAAEYRTWGEQEMRHLPVLENIETTYSCDGGMNSFAIDPYGLSICVLSHQETYDIRSGSVKDGWEQFLLRVRTRARKSISKCVSCRSLPLQHVPANGELENGDPESPVEFLYEVAHLRAMALGLQAPPHGECDFCPGGRRHSAVMESAQRIISKEIDVGEWTSPRTLLPILDNRSASPGGGCGGCGAQSFR